MTYPSSGSSRRLALVAVAAAAIAASACSTSTGSVASPSSHSTVTKLVTSYSWSFTQVNDSSGGNNTQVTGISNLSTSGNPEIVGYYFNNCLTTACITTYYSFTSVGPKYTSFTPVSYPKIAMPSTSPQINAIGTQLNAIEPQSSASGAPILVGSVSNPGDSGADIYPVLYNQGLWSLEPENGHDGGKGGLYSGYLFGINDNQIAVGYYTKNGHASPAPTYSAYLVSPPSPSPAANSQFAPVPFPSSFNATDSWAYGINDKGDMVGAVSENYALPVAWYALCRTTCSPSSPSMSYCWTTLHYGTNTTAYAINNSRLVVGSYQDATTGATYGFLATVLPTTGTACNTKSVQEGIYYKNGTFSASTTVVRSINDEGYIAGWYATGILSGGHRVINGFVGKPTPGSAKRRRSHR